MLEAAIVILILLVLFLFLLAIFRPIRIVSDYERLVLFRLGRFVGERGPGAGLALADHRPGDEGHAA